MSKSTEWLEQFTGMTVEGDDAPGGSLEDAAADYEQRLRRQQVMLATVRQELLEFKTGFQQAMAEKIKEGKLRGQRLLKEDGTQLDEVEAEEMSVADLAVSDDAKRRIAAGSQLVIKLNERLKEAKFVASSGEVQDLFTPDELQREYWTPLMRERILPETYIPAQYSETQRMLDESNEAYLKQVEERKAKGMLTPGIDRGRMLIDSAADLVDITGSLLGGFAPGTKEFKLAQDALQTTAAVIRKGAEVYDSAKAGKFADASSSALEVMGTITVAALGGSGVDPKVGKAVSAAFSAGGAAIKCGAAFAQGIDGAEDGLTLLGTVVERALDSALAVVADDKTKRALGIAKATVPALFKQAAIGMNLRQKIYDEDYPGIVQCLGQSLSNVLNSVQEIRAIELTRGKSEEESAKIEKQLQEQTGEIQNFADMGQAGVELTIKATIAIKRGEYLAALNGIVDDIGGQLTNVLESAGVPKEQAVMIGQCYVAASSGSKALQCLTSKDCDVPGALNHLSSGILIAFKQAAPDNQALQQAGTGLAMSLQGIGAGLKTKKLFDEGNYTGAIEAFTGGLKGQLGSVFDLAGVGGDDEEEDDGGDGDDEDKDEEDKGDEDGGEEGEEEEDPGLQEQIEGVIDTLSEKAKALAEGKEEAPDPKEVLADLRRAARLAKKGGKLAGNLETAQKKLEEEQKKAAQKAAREEADELLAEANGDLQALSDAQKFGAEASSIDKLIAKIERDRMILNLAMQIAQGGAGFLAKFVPALGAVAAGIKLAAQLHAAGLRAQQLYRWMQNQDDLEAAQSALSSSAQNFVRNQGEQLAHYAAQALFAAAQLAAEITKLSGVAAPVGMGLDAAASAGSKLEEIIRRHKRAEDLEAAWKVTAKALRNPTNRKLGLEARKLNPSLAKYAIAWGAVVQKDPLARNAMKACNLGEASLNNPDSDVDKVVQYLETFYNEDQQLYRELDTAPPWVPDDLSLDLGAWTRLKRLSVSDGKLLMLETGKIDGLLAQLGQLPEDVPWDAAEAAMVEMLKAVAKAKKDNPPGTKLPPPDTRAVRSALADVEAQLATRVRLFEQLGQALGGFQPQANPEAAEKVRAESLKAMGLAIKSLVKQASTGKAAADTDMQRAAQELMALEV